MPESKFKITNPDIENNPKYATFSSNEKYHTVRTDSNGKVTFDGFCSGYQIENGEINGIPSSEIREWADSVEEFIYNHNEDVYEGKGFDIKFNILDHDSRMAFKYEEYSNGVLVKSGTGWGDEFETDAEMESWIDAVRKYKKDNGIKMPTDKIREKLDKIEAAIKSLDVELPKEMEYEIPTIKTALPKASTDPCQFLSDVKKAAMSAIGEIGGMPSPKDVINYNAKVAKHNAVTKVTNMYDSETAIVTDLYEPISQEVMGTEEYFAEVDAYWDEIEKDQSDSICLFETVVEPPFEYKPPTFTYDDSGSESNDGTHGYLPGNANLSNVAEYKPGPNDSVVDYKEVTLGKIYNKYAGKPIVTYGLPSGTLPDIEKTQVVANIKTAMRNLFVPLRKGWEDYCKKQLNNTNPTWIITSGYRPYLANSNAGGSAKNSAHRWGFAIDVQTEPYSSDPKVLNPKVNKLYEFAAAYVKQFNLPFDQLLIEQSKSSGRRWLHIGYARMTMNNGVMAMANQRRDAKFIYGA